jgi:hypothetical protein
MRILHASLQLSNHIKHGGQITEFCYNSTCAGGLAERFKAPSWKGGEVQASVSSNLMSSARYSTTHLLVGFLVVIFQDSPEFHHNGNIIKVRSLTS